MLYASISNALKSQAQSVFDLKLSRSKGENSESNFGNEVAWLYEASQDEELLEENSSTSPKPSTPQPKNNLPTDCLFFDQFISLHQPTPRVNKLGKPDIEHRIQVNAYLNKIVESQ